MTKNSFIKILGVLLVVGLLFAVAPTKQAQAATVSTWDGTYPTSAPGDLPAVSGGVQEVTTAAQFAWLASQTDMFPAGVTTVKLMVDINLANLPWTPSGGLASGSAATGNIFDGNGHTISNLRVVSSEAAGLFVGANGGEPIVQNLVIEGAYIEATPTTTNIEANAAVVAVGIDGGFSFSNVTVRNATVKGTKYVAGISAYSSGLDADGGYYTNCTVENTLLEVQEMWNTGEAKVEKPHVGGIVGLMNKGTFSGNSATNLTITVLPVNGELVATERVGALIGTAQAPVLVGTYDISNVTYNTSPYTKIIGLDNRTYKVVNATQMLGYTTIQAAVTASADGDVINVAAGTYNEENITITKGISLLGAGAATTSIAPTAVTNNSTLIVSNPSGNVKIDGFNFVMQPKPNGSAVVVTGTVIAIDSATVTISNNIITGSNDGSKSDYGFYGQNNNAKVIIENNTINNTGDNPICFEGQAGSTTVRNNVFRIVASPDYDPYFSMAYAGLTVLTPQIVEGNTFYLDHAGTGYASAITFNTAVLNDWYGTTTDSGHYTNILIKDNVIYTDGPQARGVNLADRSAGGALGTITGAVITGNQIIGENLTDVNTYGVALKGDVQSAQIQSNIINNVDIGIRIIPGNGTAPICPSGSTISSNQITSVGVSVKNECTSGSVDVTHNWWGSAAGPTAGTMVGTVSYDPWCGDADCSFFVTQAEADALAAVNAAADATAMQTALENHSTVWDLDDYNTLETGRKPAVAADLLSNRPVGGFTTVAAVQSMLDEIVGTRLVLQASLNAVNTGTISGLSFLDPVIANLQGVTYTLMNGQPIADILPGLISTQGIFNSFTLATQGEILAALTGADYLSWSQMFGAFYNLVNGIKPELALDPVTANTDVCAATNTLNVMVADAVDLQGYRIEITFDTTKIQILDVVNGGFLATTSLLTGEKNLGNDTGRLILDLVTQSGVPGTALTFDGSGTLVTITYKALGGVGANTSSFILDAATSKLVRWTDDAVGPIYPAYDVTVGTANVSAGGLLVRNTTVEPDADYCSLTTAVAAATSGDTLQLLDSFSLPATVTIDKTLTLDLNDKVVTYPAADNSYAVKVDGAAAALTVIDGSSAKTGKILVVDTVLESPTPVINGRGIGVMNGGSLSFNSGAIEAPYAGVYVRPDSSMTLAGGTITSYYGVVLLGDDSADSASLSVTGGTINAVGFAISGNGTAGYGGTKISISGGNITSAATAIYHPQDGTLSISGGTISGYNGIEMKAGNLTITAGTVLGTGAFADPLPNDNGSANTGDAILLNGRDAYSGDITVNISGTPTITSTSAYALRDYNAAGQALKTSAVLVSGGFFTGGTGKQAVTFSDAFVALPRSATTGLMLTDGAYNTDPGASPDFVFTPYDSYVSGTWFMIDPVDITATTLAGPYTAGAPSTVTITVADTDHTGPFEVVFTYPEGTVISYGGTDYVCTATGCPVITVTLSDPGPTTLSFAVTLPGVGPYDVGVALNHKAGTTDIRLLDSETQKSVTAAGAYVVNGSFSLQARYQGVKLGIPVNFKWTGTVFSYSATAQTDAAGAFAQTLTFGGSYTVTTSQERYLNVEGKTMALSANKSLPTLMLKGGNAYWKASADTYDNIINGSDASLVGSQYGSAGSYTTIGNHGDCNFDGIVNIQDLALVGGNWYLTSAAAYAGWLQ